MNIKNFCSRIAKSSPIEDLNIIDIYYENYGEDFVKILKHYLEHALFMGVETASATFVISELFEHNLNEYFSSLSSKEKEIFIYSSLSLSHIKASEAFIDVLKLPHNFSDFELCNFNVHTVPETGEIRTLKDFNNSPTSLLSFKYTDVFYKIIRDFYGEDRVNDESFSVISNYCDLSWGNILKVFNLWSKPEYADYPLSWALELSSETDELKDADKKFNGSIK